jgi:hypothetical protein
MTIRRTILVGALALGLVLVEIADVAARSRVAPKDGALFGAWVGQRDTSTHYGSVLAFEEALGRKLAIDLHYRSWDNDYWREERRDVARGRVPLITWDVRAEGQAADINDGVHDALIREKARAIAALDGPVLLRWGAEMSGGRYGPPAEYIAAWRRIQGIFADRGADNVEWVWCPTAWSFVTDTARPYYPGDANVDWICADGFNWYPAMPPWKSFTKIFEAFYEWGSRRGKPLMIGETGVMEDPEDPGRKAEWFRSIAGELRAMPAIKAFVYFHSVSPAGYGFWADTSASAMTAFQRLADRRYLAPMPRARR